MLKSFEEFDYKQLFLRIHYRVLYYNSDSLNLQFIAMKTFIFLRYHYLSMIWLVLLSISLNAQKVQVQGQVLDHLQQINFEIPQNGEVQVLLPKGTNDNNHFITGTIQSNWSKNNKRSGYTLQIVETRQVFSLTNPVQTIELTEPFLDEYTFALRDSKGRTAAAFHLSFRKEGNPERLGEPAIPGVLVLGDYLYLSGKYSKSMVASLDGKPIQKIAQTSSAATYYVPETTSPGLKELQIQDVNGQQASMLRVIGVELNLDQSQLLTHQQTYLDITLRGLESIQEYSTIVLTNQSVDVIELEKSSIPISPLLVNADGSYRTSCLITAKRRGNFNIEVDFEIEPVSSEEELVLDPNSKPKFEPGHETIPADQLPKEKPDKPKFLPGHETKPADQLKPKKTSNSGTTNNSADQPEKLVGAKAKLKIYLKNGTDTWLEFEDGWRKATYQNIIDPETGKQINTWYANMNDKPIPKDKIFDQYEKSLVEVISEMSDSGLGLIFPGLDAWNSFNKGDYGSAALDGGMECIPLLGKLKGFIRVFKFADKADDAKYFLKWSDDALKHADETMECAVESARQRRRIQQAATSARYIPSNGIAFHHSKAFEKLAKENEMFIIVRNGNPSSLKYHGRGIPKPVNVKAKTMKAGPDAGWVVNPKHPNQQKYWEDYMASAHRQGDEAYTKASKEYEEALENWKKFENQHAIKGAGGQVTAFKDGFKVDGSGRLTLDDQVIHGDYDLHGVYMKADGSPEKLRVNMGDGTPRSNNYDESASPHWRDIFNEELNEASPGRCEAIQHGSHDDWVNLTKIPDPPVTVFKPDGGQVNLNSVQEMFDFYKKYNIPWPEGYPKVN